MNTNFHTASPVVKHTARPVAFVLAAVLTLGMLQSIDTLASREQGASMMARAASTVMVAVRPA